MELGQFSVSLTVKDIHVSLAFYQKFGFQIIEGELDEKWVVLRKGEAVIGLFQDMFPKNILTFNPADVRSVQADLKAAGITFEKEAESGTGPASATLIDPDGNPILLDQHFDTPQA